MAPRKNAKGGGGGGTHSSGSGSGSSSTSAGSSSCSSSPGARRETKHGGHKNGRKGGLSGSSFFTWFMVIALLGVWASVAVVWFDLIDYEEVLGKLGVYDADGDGDFDVDDAKVLLGLKERAAAEPTPPAGEPQLRAPAQEEPEAPAGPEPQNIEEELKEHIQSLLHETVLREHGEDLLQEEKEPAREQRMEDEDFLTGRNADGKFENLEVGTYQEETEDSYHGEETASQDYNQDTEEILYEQENPDSSEPAVGDERLYQDADDVTYQDYDEPVDESSENERIEISDNVVEESHIISEEGNIPPAEEQQAVPPDT